MATENITRLTVLSQARVVAGNSGAGQIAKAAHAESSEIIAQVKAGRPPANILGEIRQSVRSTSGN